MAWLGLPLCPGVDSGTLACWRNGCQGKRRIWVLERPQNQPLGLGGTSGGHLVQASYPDKLTCLCFGVDMSCICLPTSCA